MTDEMRLSRASTTERLRALADEAGIIMRPMSLIPNSRLALEAAEVARDAGGFDAFHRSVFEALFGRDQNIGDVDVLVRLAAEAGMDPEAMRAALAGRTHSRRVDEQTAWARERGVTGTPTFIFDDRFEIVGAQEYAVFAQVAQRMGAEKRE
jgi:predicted DsbA family dithiol-disulfide isomerase